MDFGKIKILFLQFSILKATRISCAEIVRKILDPYNISSYSQTGEDRILESFLENPGFYVEVGCNHPQSYSNTFNLYKRGWTGITIDANHELIQKHQELRKRDLSICAVVSNKEGEAVFTDFEDSLVSSLDTEHITQWSQSRKIKAQRTVNTRSLTSILEDCQAPKDFALLCIDVEGHDFEVLSSLNFDVYRPKLIIIEMHGFDVLDPESNEIYQCLIANDYKMTGYIVMNGYFSAVSAKSNEM
jgi:FkbM family methyltransferase